MLREVEKKIPHTLFSGGFKMAARGAGVAISLSHGRSGAVSRSRLLGTSVARLSTYPTKPRPARNLRPVGTAVLDEAAAAVTAAAGSRGSWSRRWKSGGGGKSRRCRVDGAHAQRFFAKLRLCFCA